MTLMVTTPPSRARGSQRAGMDVFAIDFAAVARYFKTRPAWGFLFARVLKPESLSGPP